MAYTPSTGSYVPIHQQSPEAFTATPHTSRAPPLPGAALYRRKLLEQSAFPSQNNSRAISSTRALKMTAPKHSTSPPPSSQDRKVRRINDSKIQQFHGRSHSPAPEQSIGMSDSTRGTQHNPMEILSSPEPEPVRTSYTKKKQKYYAVAIGHGPGIYTNWDDAQLQVHGYPAAKHKSFATRAEAESWLKENMRTSDTALYSGTHFTTIKPERSMANQQFSAAMHSSSPPRYYEDLTAQTSQHVPKVNEVSLDPEPILKPEQQKVVDLILEGHNVFYTGSAGCGKSTILKAFVKQLTLHGKRVKIVAPTNLAALNVGGVTTWSFAGWTPDSMKKSLDTLMKNSHGIEVWERFDSTDVLVIDEISMVENLLFERLNHIMKASIGEKHGGGPFGGIQVIVTGDFCQLSPVRPFQYCIGCGWELIRDNKWRPKEYRCENKRCREDVFQDIDKWAFRSKAWEECDFKHINLTEIHRQSDKKFISILQRIRTDGVILKPHANILLNHTSETEGAIQLFARRDDVDRVNNENISKLPSDAITYKCVDHFNWKDHHRDDSSLEKNTRPGEDGTLAALKEHRYEVYVHLKEGMRIVLQANLEPSMGLVNGSQGTILGFEPFDEKRLPRKPENRTEAGAAGMNFTRGAHARYFEEQIKTFGKENKRQPWPIVKFDNGLERTIFADCTASELGNEEPFSLLSRTQIPLMAGYAITVHKSQGMTLERVIVDLSRAFEPSQIYVALSRARSLKGLKVIGLPRTNLGGANEQVKEFFEKSLKKA